MTKRGLAVCFTRPPTDKELQTFTPYDITADDIWNPTKYDEPEDTRNTFHDLDVEADADAIHPDDDTLRVLHIHSAPKADKMNETETAHRPPDMDDKCPNRATTVLNQQDVAALIPKFLYRPHDVVRRTLQNTTALAKGEIITPLRRHLKSRFPQLNVPRSSETVTSDTLFGSEPGIGGITCAQLFVGMTSNRVDVYAMRSESEGPEALQDYIRMVGAPATLRTDNSKMQLGKA